MHTRQRHGGKRAKDPVRTLLRLLACTFSRYRAAAVFVGLFVILAASANIVSTSRLAPIASELMRSGAGADMGFIYRNILFMGVVYLVGALATFAYNRIMVYIAQGTLRTLRDEMFKKMQRLPLRFFDANTHGDLMSLYTNDVDTMRQLLSQTIPQILSSCITMVMAVAFMLWYSVSLSLVVFAALALILTFVKRNGGRSSRYFLEQQTAIGRLNGFMEEMTSGQKVIKTFCHEKKAEEQFRVLNDELNRVGRAANSYAFIMISLYAKPGQKIAFVGSTGAGKTTITNLINRFYDIQAGRITYDGLDIREICKDDLRRSLGVVLQDTHLFTGTVMDNIRYGRPEATDEECIRAARLANADFFIAHLPEGYQTMLHSDGANLSQGQRQLPAIARAMVSDCPVLILDEATSSIDTYTEKLIEKGMDTLMEGRTVFVIAHRLSTVRNSQAILVLEHGEIIERGDHEQLLAQKGRYYQLYTGAFELD